MSRIIIPTESLVQHLDTLPTLPDEAIDSICQGIRQLPLSGIDLRQPIGIDALSLYVLSRDLLQFRRICRLIDPDSTDLTLMRLRALLPENNETGDSNA